MVRASMCEWATRFGNLYSRVPNHSEVAYKSRIWGEVASSNRQKWVGSNLGSTVWFTTAMK